MAMDVVGGADGWGTCAQTFGIMNTDVQVGDSSYIIDEIEQLTFSIPGPPHNSRLPFK